MLSFRQVYFRYCSNALGDVLQIEQRQTEKHIYFRMLLPWSYHAVAAAYAAFAEHIAVGAVRSYACAAAAVSVNVSAAAAAGACAAAAAAPARGPG